MLAYQAGIAKFDSSETKVFGISTDNVPSQKEFAAKNNVSFPLLSDFAKRQVAAAFTASFREMRKTALTNAHMYLWSPAGVKIKSIQQVYPNIVPLELSSDAANPRQQIVSLGSLAAGEQRDYLLDLVMSVYPAGQQFVVLRPSLKYFVSGANEQEEKSANDR